MSLQGALQRARSCKRAQASAAQLARSQWTRDHFLRSTNITARSRAHTVQRHRLHTERLRAAAQTTAAAAAAKTNWMTLFSNPNNTLVRAIGRLTSPHHHEHHPRRHCRQLFIRRARPFAHPASCLVVAQANSLPPEARAFSSSSMMKKKKNRSPKWAEEGEEEWSKAPRPHFNIWPARRDH